MSLPPPTFSFFFFNDTATTEIYTLSLHDALPILFIAEPETRDRPAELRARLGLPGHRVPCVVGSHGVLVVRDRSEEHTSELQSQSNLVCRLLLEKKKKNKNKKHTTVRKESEHGSG